MIDLIEVLKDSWTTADLLRSKNRELTERLYRAEEENVHLLSAMGSLDD